MEGEYGMTRKEERIEAAKQRYGEDTQYLIAKSQAFLVGAKWADETMIDKACSILEDMTDGKLVKRFISEFKNKLKYGILERH